MKPTAILLAMTTLAACGRSTNGGPTIFEFVPTSANGAQIFPHTIPFTSFASRACPTGRTITTSFDLVVVAAREMNASVNRVTIHLLDGSNVGGPGVTFPSDALIPMFGNTAVAGTRTFPFRPEFDCHFSLPRSMTCEVILIDGAGRTQTLAASAIFH
jgi:hypothetical protein